MINPVNQPSDPSRKIYLRELTVAQIMPFSDCTDAVSEKATTDFLNLAQVPDKAIDAESMTAGDRVLALLWYRIHTNSDPAQIVPYTCPFCGEEHNNYFLLRELLKDASYLEGKPYREYEFLDMKIEAVPLRGDALEAIQAKRQELIELDENYKEKPLTESAKDALVMERLLWTLNIRNWDLERRREWVLGLTHTQYLALWDLHEEQMSSMDHGLPLEWVDAEMCLRLPPHKCENTHELPENINKEEAVTRLLWPFFGSHYLPFLRYRGVVSDAK